MSAARHHPQPKGPNAHSINAIDNTPFFIETRSASQRLTAALQGAAAAAASGARTRVRYHVLRDLRALGHVELRLDPDDSRARLVELTARGHALVAACSTPRPPPNGNSSRRSHQASEASSRRP
jgi:hypothetical protein